MGIVWKFFCLLFICLLAQECLGDSKSIKCVASDSGVLIVEKSKEGVSCRWSAESDFLNYDIIRILENMPHGVAINDSSLSVYFSELIDSVLSFYSLDLYQDELMGRWRGYPLNRLSFRESYALKGSLIGFCFLENILTVIEIVNQKIFIVQKIGKNWVNSSDINVKGDIVSWDCDGQNLFFLVDRDKSPFILNYGAAHWDSYVLSAPVPSQIVPLGDRIGLVRKNNQAKNISVTIFDKKEEFPFLNIVPKNPFFILKGTSKGLVMYLNDKTFYRWSWPSGTSNGEEKSTLRNVFWETTWQVVIVSLIFLGGWVLILFFKSGSEELLPLSSGHLLPSPILRFVSLAIDLLPMSFLITKTSGLTFGDFLALPSLGISLEESLPWVLIVLGTGVFSFFCEALFGATIGKKLFGLRVFSFEGGLLRARSHLCRHALRSLMLLLPILSLSIFFSVHGRTVADVLSGAVVIKKRKEK